MILSRYLPTNIAVFLPTFSIKREKNEEKEVFSIKNIVFLWKM